MGDYAMSAIRTKMGWSENSSILDTYRKDFFNEVVDSTAMVTGDKRPSKPDIERRLLSRFAPKDKPKTPFLSPHRNIEKARESDTVKEIDERIEIEDDPEQKKILKKARDNAIQQSLAKQKLEAFQSLSSDEQTRLLTTVNTSYKRTLDELNLIILKHNYKDERRPITKENAEKYFSGDADKVLELQNKMRKNKHQSSITIGKHILNEKRSQGRK